MSAELAIQKAVVAALKAAAPVSALVGARVFDRVPPDAAYPYVNVGEIQLLPEDTDCGESAEVFVTIHVWSNTPGAVQARDLAAKVRAALHRQALTLDDPHVLTEGEITDVRVFADPNPTLTHGVITYRALVEG